MSNFFKSVIALLAVSSFLYADSDSASITVKGYITEVVSVSVSETNGLDNIDLNSSITDQEIGQISLSSNAKDGFTVSLQTTNDLNFKGNGSARQEARYTLKYLNITGAEKSIGKSEDGSNIVYTDGSGAVIENIGTQSSVTNVSNRTLKINYSDANLLWEPEFSDSITITVASK